MLLMPNKKKMASLIVAGLGKSSADKHVQKLGDENGTGDYKLPEDEDGQGSDLEVAMSDFLTAMGKKDAAGMARAFKSALVLCEGHEETATDEAE